MNDIQHLGDTAEFEESLRAALNTGVDAQLGPRREAPPFDPSRTGLTDRARARRARLTPLLAAACVALVAAGAVLVANFVGGDTQPPTRPVSPTHTSAPMPTPDNVIDVDGARLVLPRGWTIRPYARWLPKDAYLPYDYCLSPKSQPVKRGSDTCPLAFTLATRGLGLDPDIEGGYSANPRYCAPGPEHVSAISHGATFGDRPAQFRAWSTVCAKTHQAHKITQYVVVTHPAYVLFTDHGGRDVGQAMDFVAAHTQLPPQDAPLPLFDRGVVTATKAVSNGVRIQLRRVSTPDDTTAVIKDRSGKRYSYLVPQAMWRSSKAGIGSRVTLYTNGHRVTTVEDNS